MSTSLAASSGRSPSELDVVSLPETKGYVFRTRNKGNFSRILDKVINKFLFLFFSALLIPLVAFTHGNDLLLFEMFSLSSLSKNTSQFALNFS